MTKSDQVPAVSNPEGGPRCRRLKTGNASTAAEQAALARGEVYSPAVTTRRMRECYALWCEARESTWVRRNDVLALFDRWYAAAAEPFERGNFDVSTDLLLLCSALCELGWVRKFVNPHTGRLFDSLTMSLAGPLDTSENKRARTEAARREDVLLDADHRLTCDFLDYFVELVLPLGRANGLVRDWARDRLWLAGLTVGRTYRDVFKGNGGRVINKALLAKLDSEVSFARVAWLPLDEIDTDRVLRFFAVAALEKIGRLRLLPDSDRNPWDELDRLQEHVQRQVPGLEMPDPSALLTLRVFENIREKWLMGSTSEIDPRPDDDRVRRIVKRGIAVHNRHRRNNPIPSDTHAQNVVIEGVKWLWEREVVPRLATGHSTPVMVDVIPIEVFRHLVGVWLDLAQDPRLVRTPRLAQDLVEDASPDVQEEAVDRVSNQTPGDADGHRDTRPRHVAPTVSGEEALRIIALSLLHAQVARADDLGEMAARVALVVLQRQQRSGGNYSQLLQVALSDKRTELAQAADRARAEGDDLRLRKAIAAAEECTETAVLAAVATVVRAAAAHEAQRQMDEDNPASDEDDSPGSPNGQAKDR